MLRPSAVRILFNPEHYMYFPQHRTSKDDFSCVSQLFAFPNTHESGNKADHGVHSRFRELQEKVEMYERQQNQALGTGGRYSSTINLSRL